MADAVAAGTAALVEELEIGHVDDSELVAADLPDGTDGDSVWDAPADLPTPPFISSPLSSAVLLDHRFSECFATRPHRVVPIPGTSKTVTDALGAPVDKRRACAIISMHPKISADRLRRVHRMSPAEPNAASVATTL